MDWSPVTGLDTTKKANLLRAPCGVNDNIGAYFTFTPWGIMIDIKIPNVKIPPIAITTPLNNTNISERKCIDPIGCGGEPPLS